MTTKQFPIRLEDELVERIDRLAEKMQERTGGAELTRTAVVKAALARGLDSLETELGLAGRRAAKRK
jgi:predicted transcriptional regulator